jgi:hypothetical protein
MGAHDQLIDRLFADEDSRAIARDFVARFADQSFVSARIPTLLQEAAAANERVASGAITAEQAREQLSGFAALGAPAGVMESLTAWYDEAGDTAAGTDEPQAADPAQAPQAPAAPPAQPAPASPDRAALQQQAKMHRANMAAPQGSPEWTAYWKQGGAEAYRGVLERLEASTDVAPPVPSQPAPAPAQPATPSPTPAPVAPVQSGG